MPRSHVSFCPASSTCARTAVLILVTVAYTFTQTSEGGAACAVWVVSPSDVPRAGSHGRGGRAPCRAQRTERRHGAKSSSERWRYEGRGLSGLSCSCPTRLCIRRSRPRAPHTILRDAFTCVLPASHVLNQRIGGARLGRGKTYANVSECCDSCPRVVILPQPRLLLTCGACVAGWCGGLLARPAACQA